MKKQRSLESRAHNRYKRERKSQRKVKQQFHQCYLRARLNQIHKALDHPLPANWAILYPEIQEACGNAQPLPTEWAVYQFAATWFARLKRDPRQRKPNFRFELEMIILIQSVLDSSLGINQPGPKLSEPAAPET